MAADYLGLSRVLLEGPSLMKDDASQTMAIMIAVVVVVAAAAVVEGWAAVTVAVVVVAIVIIIVVDVAVAVAVVVAEVLAAGVVVASHEAVTLCPLCFSVVPQHIPRHRGYDHGWLWRLTHWNGSWPLRGQLESTQEVFFSCFSLTCGENVVKRMFCQDVQCQRYTSMKVLAVRCAGPEAFRATGLQGLETVFFLFLFRISGFGCWFCLCRCVMFADAVVLFDVYGASLLQAGDWGVLGYLARLLYWESNHVACQAQKAHQNRCIFLLGFCASTPTKPSGAKTLVVLLDVHVAAFSFSSSTSCL